MVPSVVPGSQHRGQCPRAPLPSMPCLIASEHLIVLAFDVSLIIASLRAMVLTPDLAHMLDVGFFSATVANDKRSGDR